MPTIDVNNHELYYEVHGSGDPALCMGGWDTFCHGREKFLARGLTDRYSVAIFDYRGIGDSTDNLEEPAGMDIHADDAIALMDHLGWKNVHFVGLVGMGACVAQRVAIRRPDLVRSMVNMGAWVSVDPFLRDQLEMFRDMHAHAGWAAFQKCVAVLSFLPEYYNENHEKFLGSGGVWGQLEGRLEAHSRLLDACVSYDVSDELGKIQCPTLVIHAGQDMVTSPRTTIPIEKGIPGAEGVMWEEVGHVVAGKAEKIKFCEILFDFLDRVERRDAAA